MTDVLAVIDAALRRKELSDAAASRLAVGNPSLIKNMRNGAGRYSFEALEALAKVLDLDCKFGPADGPPESTGLAEAQAVFVMDRSVVGARARLSETPPRGAFYFRAQFDVTDRLWRGWHALVEPAIELAIGDIVYAQDAAGEVAVFHWLGDSDKVPDGMLVDPYVFGTGHESWSRADFVRLHPITWTGRTPPPGPAVDHYPPQDRAPPSPAERLDRIIAELEDLKRGGPG